MNYDTLIGSVAGVVIGFVILEFIYKLARQRRRHRARMEEINQLRRKHGIEDFRE